MAISLIWADICLICSYLIKFALSRRATLRLPSWQKIRKIPFYLDEQFAGIQKLAVAKIPSLSFGNVAVLAVAGCLWYSFVLKF